MHVSSGLARYGLLALFAAGCTGDYEVHENLPKLEVATDVMDFDEVVVGAMGELGLAIDNTGLGDLVFEDVSLSENTSPDFVLLGLDPMVIEPHQSGVLSVRYVPDVVGQDYGAVELLSNDPDQPELEIQLVGFGVEPHIDVDPETLWFGDVVAGSSETLQVEIKAAGTGTTRIENLSLESGEEVFSYSLPDGVELPYALASGFSVTLSVTFAPVDDSSYDTHLLIASNDPEQPTVAVRLLGNSEAPPENQAPTVEITDPDFGTYALVGQPLTLAGQAVDLEDGPEGLACTWMNGVRVVAQGQPDATGALSTVVDTSDWEPGETTLSLYCMDSSGEVGADSVTITMWSEDEPLRYTITGGASLYDYWSVDDDITIELDGVPIFKDTNGTQDNHPPIEFDAEVGSVLRIVATDRNYCTQQLDALYLHWGTGQVQPLNEEICVSACSNDPCYDPSYQGPWPNVFLDQEFTIQIPATR